MTIHPDTQYELARLRLQERLTRSLEAYEAERARRPETMDASVRVLSRRRARGLSWTRLLIPHRHSAAGTA